MKLTPRQKVFCHEYLKDENATQSAIRAGYSKRSAASIGSEILQKEEVQKYLSECREEALDLSNLTPETIIKGLAREATRFDNTGSTRVAAWRALMAYVGPPEKSDDEKEPYRRPSIIFIETAKNRSDLSPVIDRQAKSADDLMFYSQRHQNEQEPE